ncbi:MAG: penicillin-binding protein 2 [Moraxella sp.]|nr:penicillin-binding protein 2 [Moraxella sp.]
MKNTPKAAVVTKPLKRREQKSASDGAGEIETFRRKASGNKTKGAASLGGMDDLWRFGLIWSVMGAACLGLVARACYLQVVNASFFIDKSEQFSVKKQKVAVSRGMITDINGVPLAANAPLITVVFDPHNYALAYYGRKREILNASNDKQKAEAQARLDNLSLVKLSAIANYPLEKLQAATNLDDSVDVSNKQAIAAALPKGEGSRRMVLLNQVTPEIAALVTTLNVAGIGTEEKSKRFYLQAEPMAQIIGFMGESENDKDYKGRAGIEGQYDEILAGKSGEIQVLQTGTQEALNEIKEVIPAVAGQDVQLTIDSRLQYVLYKELEQVGRTQSARWASGMVVDISTGDVLAMGSWPSLNTNKLSELTGGNERNRAALDVFEPGSVMKPFTVAAALESGKYNTSSLIDTDGGSFRVPGYTIRDGGSYGKITLAKLIQKSSNVASTKIALNLPASAIADMQRQFGFGQKSSLNFSGEASGSVKDPAEKEISRRATLSYGYGQQVTLAQLAQAYATLGNGGLMQPLRLVLKDELATPKRVISEQHANDIVAMMELVTQTGGTAKQAAIDGYRVAGKTGTSRRNNPKGGYYHDQYRATFAGVAPASNPRFAVVVQVEDPRLQFYAGPVAAPVFAKITQEALRLYNVPFDKPLDKANTAR